MKYIFNDRPIIGGEYRFFKNNGWNIQNERSSYAIRISILSKRYGLIQKRYGLIYVKNHPYRYKKSFDSCNRSFISINVYLLNLPKCYLFGICI